MSGVIGDHLALCGVVISGVLLAVMVVIAVIAGASLLAALALSLRRRKTTP